MKKERIKRYSQSFKQQVVREYEAGTNIYQLRQKFRTVVVHIQTAEG